ncbi:MAG TPA: lysylphosphatidylglycerol synthase transmembrane domain-containing protein, partial [Polyangia bacterium]
MKKLIWKVTLGVAAGVAIYVAFSVWAGARSVGHALATFNWTMALIALAMASLNYGVRFARWHYYLRVLGLRQVTASHSLLIFLAGFSLTVTPGKLGEAVKALLLRESHGIPAARTAPIVVAERFTDLVGLLLLACVGVFSFHVDRRFLAVGAVAIALGLVVVSVEPIAMFFLRRVSRLPGVHKFADKLLEAYQATAALLKPGPLVIAVLMSTLSWYFECVAFVVVVHGFSGAAIGNQAGTFIYASMTVAGALSFLPGGLGVTEAGMLALLG